MPSDLVIQPDDVDMRPSSSTFKQEEGPRSTAESLSPTRSLQSTAMSFKSSNHSTVSHTTTPHSVISEKGEGSALRVDFKVDYQAPCEIQAEIAFDATPGMTPGNDTPKGDILTKAKSVETGAKHIPFDLLGPSEPYYDYSEEAQTSVDDARGRYLKERAIVSKHFI